MKERCPNSCKIGIAKLQDYALCFPRLSKKRQGGVASIKSESGATVWGVMFELSDDDVLKLNKREGYVPDRLESANSYNQIEIEVIAGNNHQPLGCFTYLATLQGEFRPSQEYMGTIISGAKENSLPEIYIEGLAAIKLLENN